MYYRFEFTKGDRVACVDYLTARDVDCADKIVVVDPDGVRMVIKDRHGVAPRLEK